MAKLKNSSVYCVVDSVSNDRQNRNTPTVFLTCSDSKFKQLFLSRYEFPVLYDNAIRGDIVKKEINTLKFEIIKKDTVLYFYPQCDGREIK
jgi:hypothetical protein